MAKQKGYTGVRSSEYRYQSAIAVSLVWTHFPDRTGFILHEGRAKLHPDIVLIDPAGKLFIYELKMGRSGRRTPPVGATSTARAIGQALYYAADYSTKSESELAQFYVDYMFDLNAAWLSVEERHVRYRSATPVETLRADVRAYFGNSAPQKIGSGVSSVRLLAPAWSKDAVGLVRRVKETGISGCREELEPAATGRAEHKHLPAVLASDHVEQFDRLARTLVLEASGPPSSWVKTVVPS